QDPEWLGLGSSAGWSQPPAQRRAAPDLLPAWARRLAPHRPPVRDHAQRLAERPSPSHSGSCRRTGAPTPQPSPVESEHCPRRTDPLSKSASRQSNVRTSSFAYAPGLHRLIHPPPLGASVHGHRPVVSEPLIILLTTASGGW